MLKIIILGTGRAGGALGIALDRAGHHIETLIHHTRPANLPLRRIRELALDSVTEIAADLLIVATPDPAINSTAKRIAQLDRLPEFALHLSGSLSSGELEPLKGRGVWVGSMHPLLSISDPIRSADHFKETYFCVEGDEEALKIARKLVLSLGGKPFSIETESKPLYHAAAVMASGNVTALFDAAIEMLSNCGLTRQSSHAVLLPLLRSSVDNLGEKTTSEALTGPFARGDLEAFRRHLTALEGLDDEGIREIYLALAERSTRLGGSEHLVEILNSISIAKGVRGC